MTLFDLTDTCANNCNLNVWQYRGESDTFKRNPDYTYSNLTDSILTKDVVCWYYNAKGVLCVVIGG